jgi:hypothetical protein
MRSTISSPRRRQATKTSEGFGFFLEHVFSSFLLNRVQTVNVLEEQKIMREKRKRKEKKKVKETILPLVESLDLADLLV